MARRLVQNLQTPALYVRMYVCMSSAVVKAKDVPHVGLSNKWQEPPRKEELCVLSLAFQLTGQTNLIISNDD